MYMENDSTNYLILLQSTITAHWSHHRICILRYILEVDNLSIYFIGRLVFSQWNGNTSSRRLFVPDYYTVRTKWLQDCQWGMENGLQLAGVIVCMILVWV